MSCTRRAEFESAVCRRVSSDCFISFASAHSTPDRPKKFHHFFDFKQHHSTHTDGPAFCGCSRTSKNIRKCQKPLRKSTFSCVWWSRGPTYMYRSLCAGTTRRTTSKHQNTLENSNSCMKFEVCVCVCVVVQGPGAYRGVPPRTPTFVSSGAL